jgi:protein involved in polysaccharide export with SLBB domain
MLVRLIWMAFAFSVFAASRSEAQDSGRVANLMPGDLVRLAIWREPDLSGDFPVNAGGFVTLPKLGPIPVVNETSSSLRIKLVHAYQEFLRNPSIEVTLLRRVNILGAVKNPGLYPVDPSMTIADAVALAGGPTPDGSRREIELLRGGERIRVQLGDAVRISELPLRSGDQIFVPQRSWISRNPGLIATGISAGVSLIIAVFLR